MLGTVVAVVTFTILVIHLGINCIRGEAIFLSLASL